MVSLFSSRRHPAAGSVKHFAALLPLLLLVSLIVVGCDSTQLDTPTDTTQPSLTLQLSTSLLELGEGDAARLEVLQNGGASQIVLRNKVTWSTADPAIAAVDGSGMVLAKSAGETTVQAKTTVGTASARVRVGKGGNKFVSISPRASTLNAVGDTVRLAATVAGGSTVQKPSIAWSSLDPAIAAVSVYGTVTAKAPGIARITATAAQGADTVSVAVGNAAAAQVITVSVTPSTITVASGDSVRMAATARDGNGALLAVTAFTWSSSNVTVATVSASGVVKSLTEGSATITATVAGTSISSAEWGSSAPAAAMGGGKSGSGQIKVNGKSQNKVSVSPKADTLTIVGDTTQLTATVLDSQGNVVSDASVTWTSLNTSVAKVDAKGKVISTGIGLALITAAYGSSVDTASIHSESVSSEPIVATVSVSPETASVTVGATVQLSAAVKDASGNTLSGQTVTWSSSNTAAATVSSSGVVTGMAGGTAKITAASGGISAVSEITVTSSSSPGAFGRAQRPYTADSPWNTPIQAGAAVDANSTAMIATIAASSNGKLRSDPTQYAYPIYFADASTPRTTMICTGYVWTIHEDGKRTSASNRQMIDVPIPTEATPSAGTDGQILVIDMETGDEYDIWRFAQPNGCENMTKYNKGMYRTAVEPNYRSRGAGVPYMTGLIRPWEIAQGRINHALAFMYPMTRSTRCVWPASKTDGKTDQKDAIPQGARIQLDPTLDVNQIPGLDRTGRIIARALQEYGAYLIDTSGANKLIPEDELTANWGTSLTATTVSAIPIDRLRVLQLPEGYWADSYVPTHGSCVR